MEKDNWFVEEALLNTSAFKTWKEFRNCTRMSDQSVDQYIMCYDQ